MPDSPKPQENEDAVRARNLATMRKMVMAFNLNSAELVAQCVNPSLVSYSPHQPGTERQADEIRLQREAFPDLHYVEEVAIADGDLVFLAWVSRGTFGGPLVGNPASGLRFEVHGGEIARFRDGLIVEHWDHWLKPRLETYALLSILTPGELNRLQAGGLL